MIAVGLLALASVKAGAKAVVPNGVTVSPTPRDLPASSITWIAENRRNPIGQAQIAQGDYRAGDQWARNTFDPSRRLARR